MGLACWDFPKKKKIYSVGLVTGLPLKNSIDSKAVIDSKLC